MSDRAGTEKKFNDQFKEYRDSILPLVYENMTISLALSNTALGLGIGNKVGHTERV